VVRPISRSNTRTLPAFSILIVVLIFMQPALLGRPEVEKSLTGRERIPSIEHKPATPGLAFVFKKAAISAFIALVLFH